MPKSPPLPDNAVATVFEVRSSATVVVDTVTVIHANHYRARQDAAFSAIRQVRRNHDLPERTALFVTKRTQRTNQEVK